MKKIFFAIAVIFFTTLFVYILLPNPEFPKPPPDALQSNEPADTETPMRRAYFTNLTRAEVMDWYKKQFTNNLPMLNLNYGPEEAGAIIRDQTRSTYLEEIVHPFRESVYVNGFEPTDPKDSIFIDNRHWRQKIIIKYNPSILYIRIVVFLGTVVSTFLLFKDWRDSLNNS